MLRGSRAHGHQPLPGPLLPSARRPGLGLTLLKLLPCLGARGTPWEPPPTSAPRGPTHSRHKCPFSSQNGSAGLWLQGTMLALASRSPPHKGLQGSHFPELDG